MTSNVQVRQKDWAERLSWFAKRCDTCVPYTVSGTLKRVVGLTIEADGCTAPLGSRCDIIDSTGLCVETEVVGFAGERLFLMPTRRVAGIAPNATVVPQAGNHEVCIGPNVLGRVLNGRGEPLDGKGPLKGQDTLTINGPVANPLNRATIDEALDVGIGSINALLTLGRGQRVGLFAGSGVGKSMLLGMMTRHTNADVVVVGLIGERGREVGEFVQETLGDAGMKRAVVIATPADETPLMRLNGAWLASAIAEYFRDAGLRVLLLMDSLTRFAQAQREIGLAIGEPPTTKGYPPSVFSKLPQLVERAGNSESGKGSITAIYTVLAEGDDQNDPIVDAARAILDGHIVLSRRLAEEGVFPALDIEQSVSRSMHRLISPQHADLVAEARELYAIYRKNEDLIAIGAYQSGTDPMIDRAIAVFPRLRKFLGQSHRDAVTFEQALENLQECLEVADQPGQNLITADQA